MSEKVEEMEGGREKKERGGWQGGRRERIERGEKGRGRTREEGGLSVICETKTRALQLAMNYCIYSHLFTCTFRSCKSARWYFWSLSVSNTRKSVIRTTCTARQ